jgi:hypothetical protein
LSLEERLVMAATAAIRNERQGLGYRPEQIKGITLELTVGRDGQVKEAISFVERRAHAGALMDRYAAGRAG